MTDPLNNPDSQNVKTLDDFERDTPPSIYDDAFWRGVDVPKIAPRGSCIWMKARRRNRAR